MEKRANNCKNDYESRDCESFRGFDSFKISDGEDFNLYRHFHFFKKRFFVRLKKSDFDDQFL